MEQLEKIFNGVLSIGINPSQRLYWPLLLSSAIFCLFYLDRQKLKEFFSKKGLFHPSSFTDVKYLSLNLVLKITIFPLILFSSFSVSVVILKTLRSIFPFHQGNNVGSFTSSIALTFLAFVLNDFFRFLHHYLMHKTSFLRKLHSVHHSAVVLTPLTLFRAHPMEALLAGFRNTLSLGVVIALFSFVSNVPVSVVDILGVNIFGFLFNAIGGNLRHSPVPLSFGPFEYLFISPRMHQVHHSNDPKHFNKNYGVALTLWDHLAGSFYRPSKQDLQNIKYGLIEKDIPKDIKDEGIIHSTPKYI